MGQKSQLLASHHFVPVKSAKIATISHHLSGGTVYVLADLKKRYTKFTSTAQNLAYRNVSKHLATLHQSRLYLLCQPLPQQPSHSSRQISLPYYAPKQHLIFLVILRPPFRTWLQRKSQQIPTFSVKH